MDTLEVLNKFASAVAAAMNDANIVPIDGAMCAVMTIVAQDGDDQPIGASVNIDKGKGIWYVEPEASASKDVDERTCDETDRS